MKLEDYFFTVLLQGHGEERTLLRLHEMTHDEAASILNAVKLFGDDRLADCWIESESEASKTPGRVLLLSRAARSNEEWVRSSGGSGFQSYSRELTETAIGFAEEVICLRSKKPECEQAESGLRTSLATIYMACKLLQTIAEIRLTYPTAADGIELKNLQEVLVAAIEQRLDIDSCKFLREAYKRPPSETPFTGEITATMCLALMHLTNVEGLSESEVQVEAEKVHRQAQELVGEPLRSIGGRLSEIMVFNCRYPDPSADAVYLDPCRALFLLGEYWSIIRHIVAVDCQSYTYRVPHPLLRLIVNLRERVNHCFEQLAAVPESGDAREIVLMFLDILASGEPDDLQAAEEYTNRQLAQMELFLEQTFISVGRKTFPLNFAETAFFTSARHGASEHDRDSTAGRKRADAYLERVGEERRAKMKGFIPRAGDGDLFTEIEKDLAGTAVKKASEPPPDSSPIPFRLRLTVTFNPDQAILDGTAYALKPNGATFLNALLEAAEGDWVTGESVGVRADRAKDSLPSTIQRLIESAPGKGNRLRLNLPE